MSTSARIDHYSRITADIVRQLENGVCHGGNRAYYSPSNDYVRMPPFEWLRH